MTRIRKAANSDAFAGLGKFGWLKNGVKRRSAMANSLVTFCERHERREMDANGEQGALRVAPQSPWIPWLPARRGRSGNRLSANRHLAPD